MQRVALALVVCLLVGPLAGCLASDPSTVDPDPAQAPATDAEEIAFEKVHTPDEITEIVEGYASLDGVEVEEIGTSFEDRPLHLVELGEGDFELWIVGRQHGNEPTGAEAILLAIQALADPHARLPADAPPVVETMREHRDQLLDRLTLLFVPVGNPDGAAAYQRTTALGEDPNRDHFLFTQPAMQAMREAFWAHKPDGCLDLHNMGTGDTDYDAYGPEGPLMETEPYDRMRLDANRVVREVDAAGANAGTFNENYRSPAPADDYPNPTAFHPGTHDMFCTTRGAPGWTPEGAIPSGENGIDTHPFEWSTRLHLTTIAASALDWAGAYDAGQPRVEKAETSGPQATETVELEEADEALFQAVWRETSTAGDHNPAPARFTLTTPGGTAYEGRAPAPEAWTSSVHLEDPEPGEYTLDYTGPAVEALELRTYVTPPAQPLVEATRGEDGVTLTAPEGLEDPVEVHLSDVADASQTAVEFANATATAHPLNGTVEARVLVEAEATLAPGETWTLETPSDWEDAGPYRATATVGGHLHAIVEDAYNDV